MSNGLNEFWTRLEQGCQELKGVQTVADVVRICYDRWGRSSEDAFFPGGCGDTELLPILLDAGWSPVWFNAEYYWAARQPDGQAGLTYIEGDIAATIQKRVHR